MVDFEWGKKKTTTWGVGVLCALVRALAVFCSAEPGVFPGNGEYLPLTPVQLVSHLDAPECSDTKVVHAPPAEWPFVAGGFLLPDYLAHFCELALLFKVAVPPWNDHIFPAVPAILERSWIDRFVERRWFGELYISEDVLVVHFHLLLLFQMKPLCCTISWFGPRRYQ